MDVFISWSGERSKAVALALRDNLAAVVHTAPAFMSSEDIRSGARWFSEVGTKLSESDFGIICLTQDNLQSPWIHFEAGSLVKNVASSRVCSYLIDVPHSNVLAPLSQFQNRSATADGTWKLITDLNLAVPEGARVTEPLLRRLFDGVFWPEVSKAINSIPAIPSTIQRSDSSKLDEMLLLMRHLESNVMSRETRKWQMVNIPLVRNTLRTLEASGNHDQIKQVLRRMSPEHLVHVASEIECGPLCDAICETLKTRDNWSDEEVVERLTAVREGYL